MGLFFYAQSHGADTMAFLYKCNPNITFFRKEKLNEEEEKDAECGG